MSIREAVASDFQAIGEVCAAAFMDEELYGGLKHPHRKEYPGDFVTYFVHKLRKNWLDPSRKVLVAVDDVSGQVVGAADWQRQGQKDHQPPPFPEDDPRHPQNPVNISFHHEAAQFHNHAADISKLTILEDSFPPVAYFWSGAREENWALDLLAVRPDHGGKGHGKRLVQWGIDESKKEGIATSVISADGVEPFYEGLGFTNVGTSNVGPLAEHGMRGGAIFFIDK